jgi:murein L,D-transpeptidase YcbB/YkuD
VKRFQERHGLPPDGVIDEATSRALAVPPAARVRQIELALERYRWLPEVGEQRFVFVNVPAFELQAFDAMDPPEGPALSMRVVVGRAGRTPTPVLAAALRHVVFAPFWNVPRSIAEAEMLPKLERDPGFLASQHMEVVAGEQVLPDGPETVARLAAGEARLRQRPGPKNALGRVKFLFPNAHDVYLHDTPAQTLFQRSRRDFSHGCVRVEEPEALAVWVLRDQPDWTRERIAEALAGADERWVSVRSRILVILLAGTARVRRDGSVAFTEDLYGHDAALERALAARDAGPSA